MLMRLLGPVVQLTLIVTYSTGCHSWQAVGASPAEYLQSHRVETARITRTDGTILEIRNPRVAHDSLTGLLPGRPPVSIPLTEVDSVVVRKANTGRTIALIGGGLAALGLIGCLASDDCNTGAMR